MFFLKMLKICLIRDLGPQATADGQKRNPGTQPPAIRYVRIPEGGPGDSNAWK